MQRLLLKLSGEALGGDVGFGIDPVVVRRLGVAAPNVDEILAEIGGHGSG